MKKLVIEKFGKLPKLLTTELPHPGKKQVLVKMKYAPINPADLGFMFGKYGITRTLPTGMGFEGSGVIEQCNESKLKNRKVSVLVPSVFNDGTYSSHILLPKQNIIVWSDTADLKQISSSMINPLTVLGFKKIIDNSGFKNILLSASNSQLSRMIIKHISKNKQLKINGIVRNEAQIKNLLQLGASNVYQQQSSFWEISKLEKVLFFDAVGGKFSAKVFKHLPKDSQMIVYGNLSKQSEIPIHGNDLFFTNKSVGGFWLNQLLDNISKQEYEIMKQQVVKNHSDFQVDIAKQFKLEDSQQAFREALKQGNKGKILFKL